MYKRQQSHIYLPDRGPPQFILQLEDQAFYLTRRLLHVIYTSSSYAVSYTHLLRKLLKDDPGIEIINIHGKGYKLITPSGEEQAREEGIQVL